MCIITLYFIHLPLPKIANETLFKYVKLWLESSVGQSQAIRYRLDSYLLPSLA